MATPTLSFFGPFEARDGSGRAVDGLTSPKIQALLSYLALERERPHHRDALAALLWPEKNQRLARQNLRQSLRRLQQALGDDLLAVDQETVQWQASAALWVDVIAFGEALAFTASHHHRHLYRCRRCAAHLQTAAAAYRAEFLEGLDSASAPFEEWALLKREWLRREALFVLDQLTERALFLDRADQARDLARRQISIDPLREEGHRQLMRALAAAGRESQAVRHHQELEDLLREELDVDPAPETAMLVERLRQGQPVPSRPPTAADAVLSRYANPLVGREEELSRIAELLDAPTCRLLTLVGPGGAGKSRLAAHTFQEKVDEFADGGAFIALAAVESVPDVLTSLAQGLGIHFEPQTTTLEARRRALVNALRRKEKLLVLDNLEHLLQGQEEALAELLVALIEQAPRLRILTTSRQSLNLRAEWLLDIGGLPFPQAQRDDDLMHYDAARLFLQTAWQVQAAFSLNPKSEAAIASICQMVEGTPLAIELAAVAVRHQDVTAIAGALQSTMDVLSTTMHDVPPRHRSMRAVFDHSWDLLSRDDQDTLAQLSVFRGGFVKEAALAVAGASATLLARLQRRSLLNRDRDGRYGMHALVRQYAAERLRRAPAEARDAPRRHSNYFASFLQQRAPLLMQEGQVERLQQIRAELENVRAAWRWATQQPYIAALDRGLQGLSRFYRLAGHFQEAEQALRAAVDALQPAVGERETVGALRRQLLIRLQNELGFFLDEQGRYAQARAVAEETIRHAEVDGYQALQAAAALLRGRVLMHQGAFERARRQLHEALTLARQSGSAETEAVAQRELGMTAINLGEYARSRDHLEQSIAIHQQTGDLVGEGISLINLGVVFKSQGDYAHAVKTYERALQISRQCGDRRNEATTLSNLGVVLDLSGHYEQALDYYGRALATAREIGQRQLENQALNNLGALMSMLGHYEQAGMYHEASLRLKRELGDEAGEGWSLLNLGVLAHYLENNDHARRQLLQALETANRLGERHLAGYTLTYLGQVYQALGKMKDAQAAYEEALALRQEMGQENLALEARAGLADVAMAQGRLVEAREQVQHILRYVDDVDETLAGTEQPFRLFLISYQVLESEGDRRAPSLLAQAHDMLQRRAATISDPELRSKFLDVRAHREVLQRFSDI